MQIQANINDLNLPFVIFRSSMCADMIARRQAAFVMV